MKRMLKTATNFQFLSINTVLHKLFINQRNSIHCTPMPVAIYFHYNWSKGQWTVASAFAAYLI